MWNNHDLRSHDHLISPAVNIGTDDIYGYKNVTSTMKTQENWDTDRDTNTD